MALYIVPEKEIAGFDSSVGGNALSRAEEDLARIAEERGVRQLMDFFSQSPAETIEFIEYADGNAVDLDVPNEAWFGAADGLRTTQALLGYFEERPDALANTEGVVRDLRQFERVLKKLAEEDVRWHLAVDF